MDSSRPVPGGPLQTPGQAEQQHSLTGMLRHTANSRSQIPFQQHPPQTSQPEPPSLLTVGAPALHMKEAPEKP